MCPENEKTLELTRSLIHIEEYLIKCKITVQAYAIRTDIYKGNLSKHLLWSKRTIDFKTVEQKYFCVFFGVL